MIEGVFMPDTMFISSSSSAATNLFSGSLGCAHEAGCERPSSAVLAHVVPQQSEPDVSFEQRRP